MSPEATVTIDAPVQYCTFQLGHLAIGVEVQRVQEVIRHERITRVPLAPEEVKGLINLRGQIITAVDLRTRLGLAEDGDLRTIVVIRTGKDAIGLLVDEVGDVVAPSLDDYEPVPVAVPDRVRRLVTGAFKLEGRLLLVLDTERVGAA
jgi:purine-binding chemotaxis protein CheW